MSTSTVEIRYIGHKLVHTEEFLGVTDLKVNGGLFNIIVAGESAFIVPVERIIDVMETVDES